MVLLAVLLVAILSSAGRTAAGDDSVIGTLEWTDGNGYVERYTFHPDHTFSAEVLGSAFTGPGRHAGTAGTVTIRERANP